MDQHYAEGGGHELPAAHDVDVVPLADVVDVDGNGGVRADAMFLHQGDELGLRQVIWGTRLFLNQLNLQEEN